MNDTFMFVDEMGGAEELPINCPKVTGLSEKALPMRA